METFELARHFMTVLEEGDVDKARAERTSIIHLAV